MNLVERVRGITTLKGGHHPYANAEIEIVEVDPADCRPTSKYVSVENLVTVGRLGRELRGQGIDINSMDEVVAEDGTVIAPPLVEFDGQADCVVDGLHRMYLAKAKHEKVKVIHVRGSDPAVPIIGKPVEWKDVRMVHGAPADPRDRRDLRDGIEDTSECLTQHYRDLSVLGSRGRRPTRNQNE